MSNEQKKEIIRGAIKIVLFVITVVSIFLIIGSVLSNSTLTFTLNWVKFLLGIVFLYAVSKLFAWFSSVEDKSKGGKDSE